ncbi:MAG: hypothetical protein LBQ50_05905 [Planctomycetaceae bacterium]|jgi:hypothetical protein|nr:hypothetical protein [Planctomycetaceae bacterium]
MMHNRRCSAAQPPDRVPPPTTKSRSDDIIDLIEQKFFLSNSMPLFLIMPSLRDFGCWLRLSGGCAALHRRLCIMSSLRDWGKTKMNVQRISQNKKSKFITHDCQNRQLLF